MLVRRFISSGRYGWAPGCWSANANLPWLMAHVRHVNSIAKGDHAMKTRLKGTIALLALVPLLALAACGQRTAPNEVSMTAAEFSPTTMSIQAGQAVHFTDP